MSQGSVVSKSGTSKGGAVFISDVTPTGAGNVGSKVTSSGGRVLDSCASDTQLVTVSVLALTGRTHFYPVVTLSWGSSSTSVTMVPSADEPLFTGSAAINLAGATTVTVTHEDGASTSCIVSTDTPAVILSANFTAGYPGAQTELKSGDTFQFTLTTDLPVVTVYFDNYGAYGTQSFSVASNTTQTVTGVIANRGTTLQNLGAKVRVQKSTGSWSTYYLTENDGSVDGTNLVALNNLYPTVTITTKTYPASQGALKDNETATVANAVSNYDTITYSSANGDLLISNTTTHEDPKTVQRVGGTYNVATNNFTIAANRAANNATTTSNTVVAIAHVPCTLTVTEPATRLRSGGNDGTSAQNHVITITSSQNLYSAPTLAAGAVGTWQGGGFSGATTTWTRSLQIDDNMVKGTYAWGAISGTNLAGIVTSAITGDGNYVVGGFVSRTLTLAAYANEVNLNTEAVTYANVTMTWNVKSLPNKRAVGTSATPDANSWCLSALTTNPCIVRILDTAATSASSVPSTITIEET